jgi:hypothetical protein
LATDANKSFIVNIPKKLSAFFDPFVLEVRIRMRVRVGMRVKGYY